MKIGPKYKIARRLGAPVFEKTQTQKYALRSERKGKKKGFSKPKSEFAAQLTEKQKARFIYGLSERQFSNYVKEAIDSNSSNKSQTIFEFLENRLDNIAFRSGLASTRLGGKQMVSHGHLTVNGRRVNVPSIRLRIGDKFAIRGGSQDKPLFTKAEDRIKAATVPAWIKFDPIKKTGEIVGAPQYLPSDNMFDLNAVVEFYSR
jgi:small subunit ribosomal protein S4